MIGFNFYHLSERFQMNEHAEINVNTYWNSPLCVDEYDKGHAQGIGVERDDALWREEFARYLPRPPARIADIGCGTGFASLLLAELGYSVTGLDQGENMLATARKKAAARKQAITFVQGNAMDPAAALPAGSFDVVVSRWVYWTLPNPEAAARGALKLLRPGGMLVVFDGMWFKNGDQRKFNPESERDRLWANCYAEEVQSELPLMRNNAPEKVRDIFENAGFQQVDAEWMHYVGSMYSKHKGERHEKDTLYVVRGYKPQDN